MDEIVLDKDLKFVLASLTVSERGELLSALLDGIYAGENLLIANMYQYIMKLQDNRRARRNYMRELSLKGVQARLEKKSAQAVLNPAVDRWSLRKEAKESDKDKYNLNLFSGVSQQMKRKSAAASDFVPPSLDDVKQFVFDNHLNVNAENFVNFYESHGWMVGSTPIKNWQATAKLWHARTLTNQAKTYSSQNDDEAYWHELKTRVAEDQPQSGADEQVELSASARQNVPKEADIILNQVNNDHSLPFARFMHRVEKYDINRENNDDK